MKLNLLTLVAALAISTPASASIGGCIECGRNGAGCREAGDLGPRFPLDHKENGALEALVSGKRAFRAYIDKNGQITMSQLEPNGGGLWPIQPTTRFLWQLTIKGQKKWIYLNGYDVCMFTVPGASIANTQATAYQLVN